MLTSPTSPKASAMFSKVSAIVSPLSPGNHHSLSLVCSFYRQHHRCQYRDDHHDRVFQTLSNKCDLRWHHDHESWLSLPAALAKTPLNSVNTSTVSTTCGGQRWGKTNNFLKNISSNMTKFDNWREMNKQPEICFFSSSFLFRHIVKIYFQTSDTLSIGICKIKYVFKFYFQTSDTSSTASARRSAASSS